MTENDEPPYGAILKSNSNGTYFGISIENVNRDAAGFVDFEKMQALDGIALINIVANPVEAKLSGKKVIQSRITHNDGMFLHLQIFENSHDVFRWYMDCSQPS